MILAPNQEMLHHLAAERARLGRFAEVAALRRRLAAAEEALAAAAAQAAEMAALRRAARRQRHEVTVHEGRLQRLRAKLQLPSDAVRGARCGGCGACGVVGPMSGMVAVGAEDAGDAGSDWLWDQAAKARWWRRRCTCALPVSECQLY